MPEAITNKGITRRARKGVNKRTLKKRSGCQERNRKTKIACEIIGNSIYDVTVQSRLGFEIKNGKNDESAPTEIYYSLFEIVKTNLLKYANITTTTDLLKNGISYGTSMRYLLSLINTHLVPSGYELNIHYSESTQNKGYFLIISKYVDFEAYWHCFELKPAIKKVRKNNDLHDFFILFIANFIRRTQIDPWWRGGLGYVDGGWMLDRLEERMDDMEGEEYQAEYHAISEDISVYNTGEAFKYEQLIKRQREASSAELKEGLSRFSKKNKIVKWMHLALDIMDWPCGIMNFCYIPENDGEYQEGVMFDSQISFIWDASDSLTQEQEDCLNAESEGTGILSPVLHLTLGKSNEEYESNLNIKSINDLKSLETWPQQITKLFTEYNNATR